MSAQTPTIRLQGTWRRPELIATFAPYDRHPQRPGRTLLDFIKSLPGRRFEKKHLHWVITGIGTDPVGKFARAGFALDPASFTGDFSHFTGLDDLEELAEPVTHLTSCGGELFIRPRFTGYTIVAEMLGHTAIWDSKRDMFRLPIGDLIIDGEPIAGLPVSEEAIAAAWKKRSARASSPSVRASAAALAQVTDVSAAADDHAAIVEHLGDVPDWFGLDLFAYQRAGALAAAAGHSFIADEPGLGKCVVPDTGVHTGGDIVPIGQLWRERAERAYADPDGDAGELIDLKAGELPVTSLDAETGEAVQAHASHLYRQRYRGLVHTITLSNGRSLSCTPRHRVWTPAGWMRVDELAAGDYIGTAMRHTPTPSSDADSTLARVMAWHIGEGYDHSRGRIDITNTDLPRLNTLGDDYRSLFANLGIEGRIALQPQQKKREHHQKRYVLSVTSPSLIDWLESCGMWFGQKSADRFIPTFIMESSPDVQIEFIRHIFAAEGSVGETSVEMSSASRNLIHQIQDLLARRGVHMSVSARMKCATNGSRIRRQYWTGTLCGQEITSFATIFGIADKAKARRLTHLTSSGSLGTHKGDRIPCIPVIHSLISAGIPGRRFGSAGRSMGAGESKRTAVTRQNAITALETVRAIRTGRLLAEVKSEPRNRWTTETLNALLHVGVALVEQVETDLQKMLSESVRWHEIVSITTSDYDGYVYDLSVPGTRSYIAEGMWTHNTRQALAAAAILAPRRILIVAPPVALTNWAKQTSQSGVAAAAELLAHEGPPARSSVTAAPRRPAASAGQHATTIFSGNGEFTLTGGYTASESTPGQTGVVVVTPGRKTPPLPDAGCVIVADSTLTSRPALLDELCQWAPEVLIDDEIHRHKNPAAQRTQALVRLSAATKTSVIGLSGTPMLKNPDQLLSQLDITGHLYPVLGSYRQAMHTYCRRREINGYSTWQPRAKALPKLGQILAEQVWVRRTKQQVLPDLPKKLRRLGWVDVDLQSYKRAHEDVLGGIADAAEDVYRQSRRWPSTRRELLDIAGDPFTVLAPLRKAAGLAKVPAAIDWILDHLNAHGDTADFDRPLIVWTHHREVAEQLSAGIADSAPNTRVETILGGMSRSARDRVVADFQDGQVGVLIASITAANVAITLTRSCDVLVVEVDWNPANISQAEDRAARIGQDRPVTVTTLAAADTIDERMHKALQDTAKTLAPVLIDGDTAVSKAQQSEVKSATQLLADLATRAVAGRKRRLKRRDDHAEKPARRRAKPVTA